MLGRGTARESAGDIEMNRQRGQRMAHDVVQIAGNAQALAEPRALVEESLRGPQLRVGAGQLVPRGDFAASQLRGTERKELQAAANDGHEHRHRACLARALDRRQRNHLRHGDRERTAEVEKQSESPIRPRS